MIFRFIGSIIGGFIARVLTYVALFKWGKDRAGRKAAEGQVDAARKSTKREIDIGRLSDDELNERLSKWERRKR